MRHTNPLDRAAAGETPDDAVFVVVFDPLAGDSVGTLNGGSVLATVLVKFRPGGGLNCKHHLVCLFDLIIEAAASDPRINSDSLLPVLVVGRYGME